ncbi:hypothetical protein C7212DRAFT_186544, partial [Tuber magnatum]
IVPYKPYWSKMDNAHFNIVVRSSIKVVKYIYKSLHTAGDKANIVIAQHNSEREWLDQSQELP